MKTAIDLTGQRFGRLTVVERNGSHGSFAAWKCVCDCGNEKTVSGSHLRTGNTTSCGCFRRERSSEFNAEAKRTHGMTDTPIHRVWRAMKDRCVNPNNPRYEDYGGRGVSVCDRWKDSFEAFLADMGERPSDDHSIEREENDGNYEPSNCKWATRQEQAQNQRRNIQVQFEGKTYALSELARHTGLAYQRLRWQVSLGLTGDEAVQHVKNSSPS